MRSVNIHEAKTHFSKLIDEVNEGGPVIIAKAGRPVAKLVRFGAAEGDAPGRIGILQGQACIPDDFDSWASDEIAELFEGRR